MMPLTLGTVGAVLLTLFLLPGAGRVVTAVPQSTSESRLSNAQAHTARELPYPEDAFEAGVEGAVVVEATLDDAGNVVRATAIAGSALLVSDALANVRLWSFEPTPDARAIIVYDFNLAGGCRKPGSLFTQFYGNIARVDGCKPGWQAPPAAEQHADVVAFEDATYPPLAIAAGQEGAVVIAVTVDESGHIRRTSVLSGPDVLIESAVSNVRQWTFRPGAARQVTIVYDFRIEGACPEPSSVFRLRGTGMASVTGCVQLINR